MRLSRLLWIAVVCISISCSRQETGDEFINIRGKKQHIYTSGTGTPTVIFITGTGSLLSHFDSVQSTISRLTSTLSYDKPGIGQSELLDSARTIQNMVAELDQVLAAKKKTGPYLLVGHSLGGFVARYFLHKHPDQVVGMVLVDPADEYLLENVLSTMPEKERRFLDSIVSAPDPTASIGNQLETKYFKLHDEEMRTIEINTSIPITLLESNKINEDELMTRDVIEKKMEGYRKFQSKVPQTKIISTDQSGHFIQISEPQLVINAITEILGKVK